MKCHAQTVSTSIYSSKTLRRTSGTSRQFNQEARTVHARERASILLRPHAAAVLNRSPVVLSQKLVVQGTNFQWELLDNVLLSSLW
jgi:hypothetical protein